MFKNLVYIYSNCIRVGKFYIYLFICWWCSFRSSVLDVCILCTLFVNGGMNYWDENEQNEYK